MKLSDLQYDYPESLVATEPSEAFRALWSPGGSEDFTELNSKLGLREIFEPKDLVVVNDTQVLRRRIFSKDGLEILFLQRLESQNSSEEFWQVLFPARNCRVGDEVELPGGLKLSLVEKGLPQRVRLSEPLTEDYLREFGEFALPPYIQRARGERHNQARDAQWYQTAWAERPGSSAAPTASLHFSQQDLEEWQSWGVRLASCTLHVGLGTFLPVKVEDLSDHKMHFEEGLIPASTLVEIRDCQQRGGRVWALGTTVTRCLEAWSQGHFELQSDGSVGGRTDLLIQPGYEFQVVDGLMTNFHQPGSTLLALVCAFAGHERVMRGYNWALAKEFRLFSYGDLSIWTRARS